MSPNRVQHLIAIARLAAVLVALAAAVTLTTSAAAGPDAPKQMVVTHGIFAKFKTQRASIRPPFTASGTFTALQTRFGPRSVVCPQNGLQKECVRVTILDKGIVTLTYTFDPDVVIGGTAITVGGTVTATGKGGSVTWFFSALIGPIAPSLSPRQVPADNAPLVGTGKARIIDATGALAPLKGKKGLTAFYFSPVRRVLQVSAHL